MEIPNLTQTEIEDLQAFLTDKEQAYLDAILDPSFMFLSDFVREAWHVLEPATAYVHGWHIDAVCEHLEAITAGHLRRLIINIPPGTTKSLDVSVMWPAWEWTFWPYRRFLTASYGQPLAIRDALKSRRLMKSNWYQARWGHVFSFSGDQNQKMRYDNDKTGFRVATSVGGSVTGERGDVRILDDPHKADDIMSDAHRLSDIEWLKTVWSTRENDPKASAEVIVMQRLHEQDTTGFLLEEVGGYEHLMLPMRFESDRRCFTSIGFVDPRQEEGELLCPDRFDEQAVQDIEKRLGSYGVAGQLQQRPAPAEGNIFKNHWWRFWVPAGMTLPPYQIKMADGSIFDCPQMELPGHFDEQLQSWDMTFKDTKQSSYVAGQVWARAKANKFLLDQKRDRMNLPRTLDAVKAMTARHPQAAAKLVEDKANGPAVIQTLRDDIPGLIAVNPKGDKVARAHAVTPDVEAGNVYLPHPAIASWVENFMTECSTFPNSTYKDQVDSMTQGLSRLMANERRGKKQKPGSHSVRNYR
jgi:predicted phage terminase large subunit-like protein